MIVKDSTHTIRVVAQITAIPVGTLRMWERRYGFPRPVRTAEGNRRLYSDEDVARLRSIAEALHRGYRVGDVIHKPRAEIDALVRGPNVGSSGDSVADVDRLIELLRQHDVEGIERTLRSAAIALGPKRFVVELAQPLVVRVGEAWADGSLAVHEEHLMSECLSTQLRLMLSQLQDVSGDPTVLLATLPVEDHTLGLAMVAIYLSLAGAKPRLLGAHSPIAEIVQAAHTLDAHVVGITITGASDVDATRRAVRSLRQELPSTVALWLGGAGAGRIRMDGVVIMSGWDDIDGALGVIRTTR
jgi:DNA-binding transcriptional MerR regulator